MKYIKLYEESNITTKVADGELLEIDDIVYHPKFGRGKILNISVNKMVAEILFSNYLPKPKFLRIDVAEMQIDKDIYELRVNAKKYNI